MPLPTAPRRIIAAVSGGVDSAVAASLLVEQGHQVEGLFMFNWSEDEDDYCSAAADYQDARQVCETLGIALHRVDFSAEYRDRVFDYFLREYAAGRTPNPDVLCNREIKFGVLLDYARRLGAEAIATGHYARVGVRDGRPTLLRGRDANKDQSYFLHAIEREALAKVVFPIGDMVKSDVRRVAWERGLHNHARKDSTGICFIGERPFRRFLSTYLPARPGPMRTADGREVGEHQGLMYYTLGQRQGLGLGGMRGGSGAWYVVAKDLAANALIVAQNHDHALLRSDTLWSGAINWLSPAPASAFECAVKTRYRQPDQAARVELRDDGGAIVRFETIQRAVTPGQYAVFYRDELCLGGGVIERTAFEHSPAQGTRHAVRQ